MIDKDFVLLEDDKGLSRPTTRRRSSASRRRRRMSSASSAVNKITLNEYNKMALSVFNDKEDP